MLVGSYNHILVFFSFVVAVLASYTALDMAGRVATAEGRAARLWLVGGAFSMGLGIWSMHFIGMLAFSLPIPLGYDPLITAGSLIIAIGASALALWLVCQQEMPWSRLVHGALLIGVGIAVMHYSGMAALRMQPGIDYHMGWLVASVLIAVLASGAALWLAFRLRANLHRMRLWRGLAALVMGLAIAGMHYTGMAAASFPEGSFCGASNGVDTDWLALLVIVLTLAVLAITLIVSILDARLQSRTSVLASSLEKANSELMQLALHDNLTRLPNRLLLEDRLSQALKVAQRESTVFAVMFMDLDGFKAVNDAYGHHIGDQLLISVTERLRSCVRAQDTLARLGGDEFVLLASIAGPDDAATLAAKLVQCIDEPFVLSRYTLSVSLSIGIAVYPGDGEVGRDLLLHADAAMYHTKSAGRNGYSFFEASMNANAAEQLQLLHDLRLAVANGELRLHYQPKFEAPAGPVRGFEALLRWQHPRRGLLAPDAFLPLAEKTGLIIPMGKWVLNEACRQLREWHQQGFSHWTVAVNLSAVQFEQPDLLGVVTEAIERHSIAPQMLTIEVTETVAMRNPDTTIETLERLTDLGIKASIDDFGTGYSSLLYLKRLPASELKIDRAFVKEMSAGNEDSVIVSAIIALAKALGLEVVAEGVETAEQQDFLTDLGCQTLQGFLLDRPMTPEQVAQRTAQAQPGLSAFNVAVPNRVAELS
ncbi:MAG: putative bifunctional diguanylate cyclase/phosphodiesterase [Pseudomonadales bacterium]|uniref:putative bifunctional diguanylate cyclase/phosphodiesterase n=1 Tax=Stutzerimonas stutzeri TaxID=316 RepID=UPI0005362BE4|nr:bifunctional diguanylate cyclase/phosphodiesterase [Stutzerimonas stutzeri]MCQ4283171.1 EAL domain-containing protein [Stutzerimonas stutzeri]BAP79352.1 putative diguanylate cyclase [Pseudomonas sp. MT-1]